LPLIDPALDIAGWYAGNDSVSTKKVGLKMPNKFGLYDMHGNVWEWCWDLYQSDYYASSPAIDPRGPASGTKRVNRSSSWIHDAESCRSACRGYCYPYIDDNVLGFRVVRTY
jgi:formylglycine-generating enzyme